MAAVSEALLDKITALPPERVAEVETFVDFLSQREQDRGSVRMAAALSEDAFARVWSNSEDDIYDAA